VLACHPAVVVDEQLDRLGLLDDLGGAFDLRPLAVETRRHDDHGNPRITPQVLRLDRRLAGRDDDAALLVDGRAHDRQLWATVAPVGGQHSVVIVREERARFVGGHARLRLTRGLSYMATVLRKAYGRFARRAWLANSPPAC